MIPQSQLAAVSSSHTPTILGCRPVRMPIGGRIRPGIMVLTKEASQHPRAVQLYEEGVARGLPFETIERSIQEAHPMLKKPLIPKNVAWFSVRRDDFGMPEIADRILATYGEDRGEGGVRLYRFRVVFPLDQWEQLMPHRYECYGANGLKFWSEFAADGVMLQCMSFAPVSLHTQTQRALRLPSGRERILRPDNQGHCEPKACLEFQRGECKLRGQLYFFIPGIPTMDVMTLGTSSLYGLEDVRSHLALISAARGGRVSGFLDDEQATFWITKELRDLPSLDERGMPIRRPQWVPVLKADLDITQLYRRSPNSTERLARAHDAAKALEAGGGTSTVENSEHFPKYVAPSLSDSQLQNPRDETSFAALPSDQREHPEVARDLSAQNPKDTMEVDVLLAQLRSDLAAHDIPFEAFDHYACQQWGSGWKRAMGGVKRGLRELASLQSDPQALLIKLSPYQNEPHARS